MSYRRHVWGVRPAEPGRSCSAAGAPPSVRSSGSLKAGARRVIETMPFIRAPERRRQAVAQRCWQKRRMLTDICALRAVLQRRRKQARHHGRKVQVLRRRRRRRGQVRVIDLCGRQIRRALLARWLSSGVGPPERAVELRIVSLGVSSSTWALLTCPYCDCHMRVHAISGERRVQPSGTLTAYVPTPASHSVHSRSTSRTVASRASACTWLDASAASEAGSAALEAAAKAGGRDEKCPYERAIERTPARAAARAAPTVPELWRRCVRAGSRDASCMTASRQGECRASVATKVRPAQHEVNVELRAVRACRSAVVGKEATCVEQPDVRRRSR